MIRAVFMLMVLVAATGSAQAPFPTDTVNQSRSDSAQAERSQVQPRRVIILKQSFYGDWRFSVDNVSFQKVSWSGSEMRSYLAGENEALRALSNYRNEKLTSIGIRFIGLGIIAVSAILAIDGGSKDGRDLALYAGAPVVALSMVVSGMASHQLKKAVAIHNAAIERETVAVSVSLGFTAHEESAGIAMSLRF